jgi:hypothetical protein
MGEKRRRRSDHRNLLYEEPSVWGIYVVIGLVVAVIVAVLAIYLA